MSDPFSLEADLALAGPLEEAQAGGISLASVRLDISAGLNLPAVVARAQRFGVAGGASFRFAKDGNLLGGYLRVELGDPYPPEVIGVALEAPLPGGGWLQQIRELKTYRGAIGVDIGVVVVSGFASIQIGDPISIVAILAAEFRPPIQLSFGFTLVGVGGVIGINRGFNKPQLEAALMSGELGAMLFPNDPVGEADRILPALDRCFPVAAGQYFAGPMLKLGWGTPTIVSATLAVIVGSDGTTAILGRFALSLPCEEVPFAVLSATIFGVIDSNGVSINGSLINSHIGPITVDGDASFKLTGGDNGTMALSVGGFHPAYPQPPGMPQMRRLSAELSPLPFASMRFEGYAALTPDSVQFGGGVQIVADLEVAKIEGKAGFDALIYFSPFRFTTDFHASISLEVMDTDIASIGLTAHFSGPGHWELSGEVTVEILWFDVDVPIELEWGDDVEEPLATVTPLQVLQAEVKRTENWLAETSGDLSHWLVLNSAVPGPEASAVISPVGALTFVQQAIPLGREITRIGGRRLPTPQTASVTIAAAGPNQNRRFPAGMFFDRAPEELLSGNGLVSCPAGVSVSPQQRALGRQLKKNLDFEDLILRPDDDGILFLERLRRPVFEKELLVSAAGGAAARLYNARELALRPPEIALVADGAV